MKMGYEGDEEEGGPTMKLRITTALCEGNVDDLLIPSLFDMLPLMHYGHPSAKPQSTYSHRTPSWKD
jgi:hypothetical protein